MHRKKLCESPRVVGLCAYDVVKTATPISTTTRDTLAIGGTIFMTFGLVPQAAFQLFGGS